MVRTTRLYTPQSLQCGNTLKLETKASHHLIKVLRAKPGILLVLFNGDGFNYAATLVSTQKNNAQLSIENKTEALNESPLHITLLQGLSRGDRMDVTLQKSVELGINAIVPVLCERSNYSIRAERIIKKMQHWQHIIISACEQSGRAVIPQLSDIQHFKKAIELFNDSEKLLLSADAKQNLKLIDKPSNKICICVGPEGGLTAEEVALAEKNNYKNIRFGPRTLRTETTGPAAIAAIQTLWGDF